MMLRYITWIVMVFMLAATSIGMAQQHEVTGTVTDATTGATLPGVNVIIDGTDQGTVTNIDGEYSLTTPSADAVLVFSYIGYERLTVPVDGRSLIDVELSQDIFTADELVVVGYGVQKRVNMTGSVSSIPSREIERRSVPSIEEALQGQVPGLNVVRTSGQPGNQAINLQIRGINTLSNNPVLTIIDGVPSSLDRINPKDIESISVLKDAASTAIYGSRASGGVILVTTKSGHIGKPQLSLSSTYSVQSPTRNAEKVSALDHALLSNEARANDGNAPKYSQSDIDRFSSPDWVDNVWDDFIFRDAFQTEQNLNISGGTESHNYYVSLGYFNQEGIIINSDFERFNIQVNQNFRVSDQLNISLKAGYSPSTRTAPVGLDDPDISVISQVHRQNNIDAIQTSDGRWLSNSDGTGGFDPLGNAIARSSRDGGQEILESTRISGNISVDYELIPNVVLTGNYGLVINDNRLESYQKRLTLYQQNNHDQIAGQSSDNFLNVNNFSDNHQTVNLVANFQNSIRNHDFSVLGGFNAEWFYQENDFISTRGFLTDDLTAISAGTGDPGLTNVSGGAGEWALASAISRIEYSFRDTYLLEGTIRYDGSSRFEEDVRWGFFPAVSAGWILTQESFLENNRILSFLKLRGSWGQVGNQNVAGFYPFVNTLSQNIYPFGGSPHRTIRTAGGVNPLLTWETKESINFGVEGSISENLLEFEVDLFREKTTDILLQLPLPTTFGQPEPLQNVGRVDNKGWELQLHHRHSFGDLSYGVSFQISDATNEIINLGGLSPIIIGNTILEEGHSMFDWYGLEVIGNMQEKNESSFFQSETDIANHATQTPTPTPGDLKYIDHNNDGVISSADRVRLGRSDPRFPFGIRINLNYRNFDFSAFGQGVLSHKVWSNSWTAINFDREVSTLRTYQLDRWTEDNRNSQFPKTRMGTGSANDGHNDKFSSFWLEDASYFRMKHIELGYNLSHELLDRINLRSARLFVSAENFTTITNYLGFDPEIPTGTGGRLVEGRYPLPKVINFGVNLDF